MTSTPFVPDDFAVPAGIRTDQFAIEPLQQHHNQSDYQAWASSRAHIKATPGFTGQELWVDGDCSLADNAASIAQHARDFAERTEFNYAVVDPATGEVIGSVYIRPASRAGHDADVRSWVRADHADLDKPLYDRVNRWLADAWPFRAPDYARR